MNTEERKRLREWAETQRTARADFGLAEQPMYAAVPALLDALDEAGSPVDRLAHFIIGNIPGEPSQNQGAVDTAIRVMTQLSAEIAALRERVAVLEKVREAAGESLSWIRSTSQWRKRCQEFDADMDNPIRDFNDEEEWDRLEAQASAQDNALRAALERARGE